MPRSRELDLGRELAAPGLPPLRRRPQRHLRKGRYGNATLSRHPILRERNIDLTIGFREAPRLPAHAHRGRTAARAAPAGSRCSTCTWASRPGSASSRWGCSPGRASSPRCPPTWPAWWAGTSTTGARCCSPTFADLLGFRCATGGTPSGGGRSCTFPSFFPQGALDRIYCRGPLRSLAARRCRLRALPGRERPPAGHRRLRALVGVPGAVAPDAPGPPGREPPVGEPFRRRIPLDGPDEGHPLGPWLASGASGSQSSNRGAPPPGTPGTYEHQGSVSNGSPVRP